VRRGQRHDHRPVRGAHLRLVQAAHGRGLPGVRGPGGPAGEAHLRILPKVWLPDRDLGASFRNTGEILELAGCDLLTIGPPLLEQLSRNTDLIEPKLTPEGAQPARLERVRFDEKSFRVALNEDEMATEKMAEAIRRFAVDTRRLEKVVEAKL
jgi:transaldolase